MSSRNVPYRDKGKEPLMDRDYKQSAHKQSSNPQEHLVDLEHDLEDQRAQGRPQTPVHHNNPLPETLKPLKKRAIKENDAADKEYFHAETADSARRLDDEGGTRQRKNGGLEGSGPSGKKQSIHTEVRKYGSSSKTGSARKLRKERNGDVKETWQALAGDDREVEHVLDGLSIAAKEDAKLNREGKPAICIVDELRYLADALSKLSPLQLAAMSSRYVPYRDKGKEPLMDRDYKQSDHKQSSNPQEHLVDLEHDLEDQRAQGRPQTPVHHNDPLPEKLKPSKKRAIMENDAADKEYFPAETADSARRLDDEGGTRQRKNSGVEGSGPSGKKQSIHTEVRKYGSSSKTGSARKLRKERNGDVKETWQALAGDDREVDHVMDGLSIAAKEDAKLNREGKPAICIVDELRYLADALSKKGLQQALLDRGILNLLRTWLQDKSSLNTATRQAILKLLIDFPIDLQQDGRRDHMMTSGLQEAVEFLFRFDDETIANRILAMHLVEKWSMNIEGRKSILPERVPLRSPSVKMRHKSSQSSSPKSAIRPEPIHTDYIVQSPSQINLNEVQSTINQLHQPTVKVGKEVERMKKPKKKQLQRSAQNVILEWPSTCNCHMRKESVMTSKSIHVTLQFGAAKDVKMASSIVLTRK